jgi:hypothetical protein
MLLLPFESCPHYTAHKLQLHFHWWDPCTSRSVNYGHVDENALRQEVQQIQARSLWCNSDTRTFQLHRCDVLSCLLADFIYLLMMSSPASSLISFTCCWHLLLPPRWLHLPADDVLSCLLDDFIYLLMMSSPASSMTSFTCSLLPPRWFHLPALSCLLADFIYLLLTSSPTSSLTSFSWYTNYSCFF